jgi:hypothetical protein
VPSTPSDHPRYELNQSVSVGRSHGLQKKRPINVAINATAASGTSTARLSFGDPQW